MPQILTLLKGRDSGLCVCRQVLFAWPEDWSKNYEKGERFVSMLRGAVNARKAVMVLKGDKRLPTPLNPVGVGVRS